MACASPFGDCELHNRRLERGYCFARCGLCAVVVINLAVSEGKTESCLRQSDCDDSLYAILSYNLVCNSQYGAGLTWWFYAVILNTIHSIALLGYSFIIRCK